MEVFATSLLERLHLKERFEQLTPVSHEGDAIKQKYEKVFEQYGDSITYFHNFLIESYNSNDAVLKEFAKIQSNNITLNCRNSWHFGIIMEKLEHSGNSLNEAIYDDLKYLLTYNESDLCEAIARGAFKKSMQVKGLKDLYESITGDKYTKKLYEGSVKFTPISYVEIKNGKKYFMVEGKIYEDDDEELKQAESPSVEFSASNQVVQNLPYNPDVDGFVCNFLPAAVNVTSNGEIFKDKEPWDVQAVEDMVKQEMEDDSLSSDIKIQESKRLDEFKKLIESFPNLVRMDNIIGVKNIHTNKAVYLFEGKKHNYILTESGIVGKYETLNEAVGIFNRYSGVNIRGELTQKLNEELRVQKEILSMNESVDKNISEAKKIIKECETEMNFCTPGTSKYEEFKSIMEDATDYIKILEDSKLNK